MSELFKSSGSKKTVIKIKASSEYEKQQEIEEVVYWGTTWALNWAYAEVSFEYELGEEIVIPEVEVKVGLVSILANGKLGNRFKELKRYSVENLKGFENRLAGLEKSCLEKAKELVAQGK